MGWLLHLDGALRAWVVSHRLPALDGVMRLMSDIGRSGVVWIAIAAIYAALRRVSLAGVLTVGLSILAASIVTNQILKPTVGRDRPFIAVPAVPVIGDKPTDRSFPSGHASNSFAGAYALSRTVGPPTALWWTL